MYHSWPTVAISTSGGWLICYTHSNHTVSLDYKSMYEHYFLHCDVGYGALSINIRNLCRNRPNLRLRFLQIGKKKKKKIIDSTTQSGF